MVGVLVAAGMLGGLALFLADVAKKQHIIQKKSETGAELTTLHNRVISILSDGEACRETLGGVAIPPSSTPPPSAPTITQLKNRKGRVVLTIGSSGNRLVRLNSVKLENIQPPSGSSTREVDVVVEFEKLSRAITGQKTVTKTIPLTLELDASDRISSCHAPQNFVMKQQLCSEMGGTWDGGTKKCGVPDCQTGEVLTKTPGGLNCVPSSSSNVPNCSDGQTVKYDSNGNPTGCAPALPNCTQGQVVGFDQNGKPDCVSSQSEVRIFTDINNIPSSCVALDTNPHCLSGAFARFQLPVCKGAYYKPDRRYGNPWQWENLNQFYGILEYKANYPHLGQTQKKLHRVADAEITDSTPCPSSTPKLGIRFTAEAGFSGIIKYCCP